MKKRTRKELKVIRNGKKKKKKKRWRKERVKKK